MKVGPLVITSGKGINEQTSPKHRAFVQFVREWSSMIKQKDQTLDDKEIAIQIVDVLLLDNVRIVYRPYDRWLPMPYNKRVEKVRKLICRIKKEPSTLNIITNSDTDTDEHVPSSTDNTTTTNEHQYQASSHATTTNHNLEDVIKQAKEDLKMEVLDFPEYENEAIKFELKEYEPAFAYSDIDIFESKMDVDVKDILKNDTEINLEMYDGVKISGGLISTYFMSGSG